MTSTSVHETVDFLVSRQLLPSTNAEDLDGLVDRSQSGEEVIKELVRAGQLTEYQQSQLLSGQGEKLCFGPYRLVKPLGEGGMGAVFKAWQPRLGRFVALKFIHASYLKERSTALIRFQRESHAIAQLRHPNIITLYDADEVDGVPFIAMEYVDGMSLSDMVRQTGPLWIKQACEYVRQAAQGLQHATELGFVHRDIKPSNIVVSQPKKNSVSASSSKSLLLITVRDVKRKSVLEGNWSLDRIKILDMGLARLNGSLTGGHGSLTPLTTAGAVLGTPDYLAPEQARNASAVDVRADLYSLGCTFYFVLTGRPPFPGGTPLEKMIRHQCDDPAPVESLRSDLPEAVARAVAKLLAKKPSDRFQSPAELATVLGSYLAGADGAFEQPPKSAVSMPPARPAQVEPQNDSSSSDPWESIENCRLFAEKPALVSPADDSSDSSELLPSLGDVTDVKPGATEVDCWIKRDLPVGSTQSSKVAPTAILEVHLGAVSGLAVTDCGSLAATGDVNGMIRLWDLRQSSPREFGRTRRHAEIQSLAFMPNSLNNIVFGELYKHKAGLFRWDCDTNSVAEWGQFTSSNQNSIGCLSFSAGGDMFAAGVGSVAITWMIENGVATKRKNFKGMDESIRTIAISPDQQLLAAAGQHGLLHFWHLRRGVWSNAGHKVRSQIAAVSMMQFSSDGSSLAMAGLDSRVAVWNLTEPSDRSVRVLQRHTADVQYVRFIGGNSRLVSIAADGWVLFWDIPTSSVVQEFKIDLTLAYRLDMSEDGTRLIVGFTNGNVAVYCFAGLPT
jgi:serine/threonine protein kinase